MKKNTSSNIGGWISARLFSKNHNLFSRIKHLIGINGLIVTLLIGIIINATSDHIQKIINRQKYFELLHWEITTHVMNANNIFDSINEDGVVYNRKPYQNMIYNSGLNNGYIFDLDPNEIAKITSYYNIIVNSVNTSDQTVFDLQNNLFIEWSNCTVSLKDEPKNEGDCKKLGSKYHAAQEQFAIDFADTAEMISGYAFEILDSFRPTKTRLESPFLRLLMGSESLEILK